MHGVERALVQGMLETRPPTSRPLPAIELGRFFPPSRSLPRHGRQRPACRLARTGDHLGPVIVLQKLCVYSCSCDLAVEVGAQSLQVTLGQSVFQVALLKADCFDTDGVAPLSEGLAPVCAHPRSHGASIASGAGASLDQLGEAEPLEETQLFALAGPTAPVERSFDRLRSPLVLLRALYEVDAAILVLPLEAEAARFGQVQTLLGRRVGELAAGPAFPGRFGWKGRASSTSASSPPRRVNATVPGLGAVPSRMLEGGDPPPLFPRARPGGLPAQP